MTRASIREGISDKGSASFKTETMELFGEEIVVRQPSLRAMFRTQEAENNRESLVDLMLECCYVPDSTEKVFDSEDKDALLDMPFGGDMQKLSDTLTGLMGINVEEAKQEVSANPTDE